jgi:hypothetical protein
LEASFEELKATMKAKEDRIMAIKKAVLEEMQSGAVHREGPKIQTAAKSYGALKKRHRGRNLAAQLRQKPKELPQGNRRSRKILAIARRMTRSAGVARCKVHFVRKN